jgi:hypothetical protein
MELALLGHGGGAIGGVPTAELGATYGQIPRLARPKSANPGEFSERPGPQAYPSRSSGHSEGSGATIDPARRASCVLTTP